MAEVVPAAVRLMRLTYTLPGASAVLQSVTEVPTGASGGSLGGRPPG